MALETVRSMALRTDVQASPLVRFAKGFGERFGASARFREALSVSSHAHTLPADKGGALVSA